MAKARRHRLICALDHVIGLSQKRVNNAFKYIVEDNNLEPYNCGIVLSVHSLVVKFDDLMIREAVRNEKNTWLEKSPEHLFYLNDFMKSLDNVKVVHILRDGRDVVASLNDAARKYDSWNNQNYGNVDKCVGYYNSCVLESIKYVGVDNHYFLNYNKLVEMPEKVLEELFMFLGEVMPSDILRVDSVGSGIIRADEGWKTEKSNVIEDTRLVKYNSLFGDREKKDIESKLIGFDELVRYVGC